MSQMITQSQAKALRNLAQAVAAAPPLKKGKNKPKKQGSNARSGPMVGIAPVSVSAVQRFPMKGKGGRRSWRFQNSELVASVSGSVAFSATKFVVNPGNSTTFPWLSGEADKWEQYRFHKLCFRYVTRTSTATVGSVILSPDYNVKDIAPTTEVQATDTEDAVEDAAWKEIKCELDVNAMYPSGPRKLIRQSLVGGDLNLYDSANFYMCTVEQVGTDAIGKLWVDYDVELFVPQNSPSDGSAPTYVSFGGRATAQTFTTTVKAALDFDALTSDFLGVGNDAAGVFTPPAGSYQISAQVSFADSANEAFTCELAIEKNSAAMTPQVYSINRVAALASLENVGMGVSGIVSCNGTDTVRVAVTLTGAAGTLTAIANSAYIIFRSV